MNFKCLFIFYIFRIPESFINPAKLTFYIDLNGLDLGGASSPGPASDGSQLSNLEPEQCEQGGYTLRERGQAQCG